MSEPSGKPEESREIASIPATNFDLSAAGRNGQVKMSFNPQTPEGAVKLVKATLKECPKLETKAKEKLHLTDWMSHPAQKEGKTAGEVQEFTRIVLFDVDGTAYECASMGVDKSIAVLELTRGKAPWKPPLVVTVQVRRLGNGNNWMILDPDIDSLSAAVQAKR